MVSSNRRRVRNALVYGWWQAQTFVFLCGVLGWAVGAVLAYSGTANGLTGGLRGLVFGAGGLAAGYAVGLIALIRITR